MVLQNTGVEAINYCMGGGGLLKANVHCSKDDYYAYTQCTHEATLQSSVFYRSKHQEIDHPMRIFGRHIFCYRTASMLPYLASLRSYTSENGGDYGYRVSRRLAQASVTRHELNHFR
jgi:hypothetical protein